MTTGPCAQKQGEENNAVLGKGRPQASLLQGGVTQGDLCKGLTLFTKRRSRTEHSHLTSAVAGAGCSFQLLAQHP